MTRPLPRWARHRCTHPNRFESRDGLGRVYYDYCPDCGAKFPIAAPTQEPTP